MTALADLLPVVREALSSWQFFRRLGYTSQQIFTGSDGEKIVVQVKWRGEIFTIGVGPAKGISNEEWPELWSDAAEVLNSAPDEEMHRMWESSDVLRNTVDLLVAMERQGIYWPEHPDFRNLN